MTALEITRHPNGRWKQNCYIVAAPSGSALIIDPGSDGEGIAALVANQGVRPLAILNTHAHYDHVGAVAEIGSRYTIPFYLHGADLDLLKRANLYRLIFDSTVSIKIPAIDRDLASAERTLHFDDIDVEVIETPGHTAGSVCFRLGECLFTGDTLLPGSIGRTDLPGGNVAQLTGSLLKLSELPRTLRVFPGHGRETSLGKEFDSNEKLRELGR
jgi:hydroxyacylglutathione hydrolase